MHTARVQQLLWCVTSSQASRQAHCRQPLTREAAGAAGQGRACDLIPTCATCHAQACLSWLFLAARVSRSPSRTSNRCTCCRVAIAEHNHRPDSLNVAAELATHPTEPENSHSSVRNEGPSPASVG